MLVKMGGSGGGIDAADKPQITFNGKWSGWYIEFYSNTPYWETVLYTSGTLTVTGAYTADVCGVGGGCGLVSGKTPGNGAYAQILGVTINGTLAITIGAGGQNDAGGDTSLGNLFMATKGEGGVKHTGAYYRFGDPDKAAEAGSNGDRSLGGNGYGGWLHWRSTPYEGEGYGGGAGSYSNGTMETYGHPGAIVVRIAV